MNDRLRMPSAMPADLAERLSDQGVEEHSAADLKEAREDLIEKLFAGKRIGLPSLGLDALLESEIENSPASAIEELASFLRGSTVGGDYARLELCDRMEAFATRICDAHLDANPDVVEERATEIAGERLELAS